MSYILIVRSSSKRYLGLSDNKRHTIFTKCQEEAYKFPTTEVKQFLKETLCNECYDDITGAISDKNFVPIPDEF